MILILSKLTGQENMMTSLVDWRSSGHGIPGPVLRRPPVGPGQVPGHPGDWPSRHGHRECYSGHPGLLLTQRLGVPVNYLTFIYLFDCVDRTISKQTVT